MKKELSTYTPSNGGLVVLCPKGTGDFVSLKDYRAIEAELENYRSIAENAGATYAVEERKLRLIKEGLALTLLDFILEINEREDSEHKKANPIDKHSESWNVSQLRNLKELLTEIFK